MGLSTSRRFHSSTFRVVLAAHCKKPYYVHRAVLASASPYFDKLFKFPGVEAQAGSVTLSDPVDSQLAFEAFIEFCYSGDYTTHPTGAATAAASAPTAVTAGTKRRCTSGAGDRAAEPAEQVTARPWVHAMVYVFAERVCTTALKKLALEKLSETMLGSYVSAGGSGGAGGGWKGKKTRTTITSLPNISRIVTVTYRYTVAASGSSCSSFSGGGGGGGSGGSGGGGGGIREPLRMLVARFCASCLEQLRLEPEFMRLVRDWPEFEADLFLEVSNGAAVTAGMWLDWLVCSCPPPLLPVMAMDTIMMVTAMMVMVVVVVVVVAACRYCAGLRLDRPDYCVPTALLVSGGGGRWRGGSGSSS